MSTEPTPTPIEPAPPTPTPVETPLATPPANPTPTPAADTPFTFTDVKLPEGIEIDAEASTKFTDIINNKDMSAKDRAQALVDLQAGLMQKAGQSIADAWNATQTKWQEEVRNDPKIGGQALEANLAEVSKLVETHGGTPEEVTKLRQALDYTGAGNNPAVIRFLFNIAKQLNEGRPVLGTPIGGTASSLADRMYPSMKAGA